MRGAAAACGSDGGEEHLMSDTRTAIDAAIQSFITNFGQQDAAGMASLYTYGGWIGIPCE